MVVGTLDEIVLQAVEVLAAVVLYFLPALVADRRKRHDLLTLALFNACLGWTVVGWIIALCWALMANPARDIAVDVVRKRRVVSMHAFSKALTTRIERRVDRR
ncbi:MAG TPA: superinfection immunity protein [Trinickia sp.]|jgi:hypothetical protein|uniref:superinfection immunity protein n=1 Tax=Trinickia sp. TaxID=2571163 RepID=UPI002BBD5777|nr:superinfection immunity protein [Trinickia sp.]